jgi:hypothetical protein
MKPITISKEDSINYNDFVAGNSIQVRVNAEADEISTYKKGTTLKVIHDEKEHTARIVSDPLVVSPDSQKGPKIVSLIIEKAD